MGETPQAGRPGARRSTKVSQRRLRARQVDAEQQARERERARRVSDALDIYDAAANTIAAAAQACATKVEVYERKIARLRETETATTAPHRERQAQAAWQIKNAGRSLRQIAALLDIPVDRARELIELGCRTDDERTADASPPPAEVAEQPAPARIAE